MRPDLYVLLEAKHETLHSRQVEKKERDRNTTGYFRARYYTALAEVHHELKETRIEKVYSDSDAERTLAAVLAVMRKVGVITG